MYSAAIPGESLTTTPKNAAWERPPKEVEPDKALAVHMDRLSDEKIMDSVMNVLEMGIDIRTITEGILRSAVSEGIHSIDVSLIIAPVIHELIKSTADSVGIDYKDGFEEDNVDNSEVQGKALAQRQLRETGLTKQISPEPTEQPVEVAAVPQEEQTTTPAPQGLMARR